METKALHVHSCSLGTNVVFILSNSLIHYITNRMNMAHPRHNAEYCNMQKHCIEHKIRQANTSSCTGLFWGLVFLVAEVSSIVCLSDLELLGTSSFLLHYAWSRLLTFSINLQHIPSICCTCTFHLHFAPPPAQTCGWVSPYFIPDTTHFMSLIWWISLIFYYHKWHFTHSLDLHNSHGLWWRVMVYDHELYPSAGFLLWYIIRLGLL